MTRRTCLAILAALSLGCGGGDAAAVEAGARATAVAVAPVVREDVAIAASYPGELESDAADLAARFAGRLEAVEVRIGDHVEAGQVVARLDEDVVRQELAEARAQLRVAEASHVRARSDADLAARELERLEPLTEQALVTAQEADAARARAATAQADLGVAAARVDEARARVARLDEQVGDARIVAPFAGIVAERYLDGGTIVGVGTPIVRVVASSPLRARFRVPERDVTRLSPGMPLRVEAGGVVGAGRVERLSGEVARADRSLAVEGGVDDPSGALRPGMFARIHVELARLEDVLVVPGAAVLERPDPDGQPTTGVFLADGSVARWTLVEVLGRTGDRVAVDGALEEGALVLVLGHESLADGAAIRVPEGVAP